MTYGQAGGDVTDVGDDRQPPSGGLDDGLDYSCALVLVEGRWSTGAGIKADELVHHLQEMVSDIAVRRLTDAALWGSPVGAAQPRLLPVVRWLRWSSGTVIGYQARRLPALGGGCRGDDH